MSRSERGRCSTSLISAVLPAAMAAGSNHAPWTPPRYSACAPVTRAGTALIRPAPKLRSCAVDGGFPRAHRGFGITALSWTAQRIATDGTGDRGLTLKRTTSRQM